MNIEHAVISKIIATGRIEEAFSKGIQPEHFHDEEARDMYEFLMAHTRRYKTCPTLAVVQEERPDWEQAYDETSLEYFLDRFSTTIVRRTAQDLAIELAEFCDDPEEEENLILHFLEASRKLATTTPSTKASRFSDAQSRIEEWVRKREEGDEPGVMLGFPTLDYWTGGLQPHEFATVSGFSGLGKSTMLMVMAHNIWKSGKTPLYISLEMESKAILRKFDAMAAGLDYHNLKFLQLEDDDLDRWREFAEGMREMVNDIPVVDDIRGCTPDHVWAETVRYKPDVVILDYLTLMRSSRPNRNTSQWQTLTEITQDLKQNCRTLGIPILAAAQTNRAGFKEGAGLDNIGNSISIVQDSDIVIGLFADEEMQERNEMEVRLNKNRDGATGKFLAVWDHAELNFHERGTEPSSWTRGGTRRQLSPSGEGKKRRENPARRRSGSEKRQNSRRSRG